MKAQGTMVPNICSQCGASYEIYIGYYNRAKKLGANLYCNKTCAGIGRRKEISPEQKKADKSEYDKRRREAMGEDIKQQKREAYHANKHLIREKQKAWRDTPERKEYHANYIKSERYRKWKHEYDQRFRANKVYGEFAEAFLIYKEMDTILDSKQIHYNNGQINKAQKRKRQWKNSQQTT